MSLLDKLFPNPNPPPQIETESIVGFRSWALRESPEGVPLLYSVTRDFCWLPFEPSHGELIGDGGIYAYKTQSDTWQYAAPGTICGEVNLWGMVLDYDEGFRAEHAYPKELWVTSEFDATMIVRLEETYGIPVVIKEAPTPPAVSPTAFRGLGATAANTTGMLTSGLGEFLVDTIYDREVISGANCHLFCLPVGQMTFGIDGLAMLKSYDRTNMWMACYLPAPERFLIKSIRCAFFEPDGSPVPVTDPIYWQSTLELNLCSKNYWRSPVAYLADPVVLLAATDWSAIPHEERIQLIDRLRTNNALTGKGSNGSGPLFPDIDGVLIDQQQSFQIKISGAENWKGRREVMCALEGISGRAVM
jgi:hypothetical protein